MSPIVARAAMRTVGRRQFSVVRSLRSFARSFEPHVFQRLPTTMESQAPDYSRLVKRTTGAALAFVPTSSLLLGWPYLAKVGLDGHII